MNREGQVSRFGGDPFGEANYMQTMTYSTTNCVVEEVTFEQACVTCPILTANGQLGVSYAVGSGSRVHITYFWSIDDIFADKTCSHRKIYEGSAIWMFTLSNEIIRDSVRQ